MKKVLVLVTALLLVGVVSLSAKPINVFVNGGMAFSDFEGAFIDLGAEMQIKGNIWGQVLIDSYLSPSGVDLPAGADESAVGITLYGVYKFGAGNKKFFVKAGVHSTTYEISYLGFQVKATDLGFAGGAGVEIKMSPKMFLLAGGTFKAIFEGETFSWFKIYVGIGFQVN
ncbi:MAG: outer membrane beta-barrel protein [Candidatus Aminicenantes bacterium]|nr:outer membrane beta-barrel protein [Candidatus Aminicenantes bacterium]